MHVLILLTRCLSVSRRKRYNCRQIRENVHYKLSRRQAFLFFLLLLHERQGRRKTAAPIHLQQFEGYVLENCVGKIWWPRQPVEDTEIGDYREWEKRESSCTWVYFVLNVEVKHNYCVCFFLHIDKRFVQKWSEKLYWFTVCSYGID